jgi:hypothetical protein
MSLIDIQAHVRSMARARSVGRALRGVSIDERNLLLILPSTIGALEFARALCARQPCRVTAGSVVADPRWQLIPHLRTPAEIVREFAGERRLGASVISFPDQIAGEGESFVAFRFLGIERRFSLLEAVLVLRHQPRTLQYRRARAVGTFRLTEVEYSHAMSAANHRTAPVRLLQTLLAGLEAELAEPPADWLAASSFALKSPVAFEFRVREELREIESLLRLALDTETGQRAIVQPALASVSALIRGSALASSRHPA